MSSPRRAGNEASILEVLERDSLRTRGLRAQSRFAWYVSGSVFAVFLVSLLVWLTRETPNVQQAEAVLAAEEMDRPAPSHSPADSDLADAAPAMAHAPTAARKPDTQQHLPPIELATPGLIGAVPPAQAEQPSQAANGAIITDVANDIPAQPVLAVIQAMPTDEQESPARAKARTGTKTHPASPRSGSHKRSAGKPKRTAAQAQKASAAANDSDVALISAVIQHTSKRTDTDCADAGCAANATPKR